jgi:hypothetical protein
VSKCLQSKDISHPRPLIIDLSKVPEGQDIHSYDGAEEWVKIYTLGLANPQKANPLN